LRWKSSGSCRAYDVHNPALSYAGQTMALRLTMTNWRLPVGHKAIQAWYNEAEGNSLEIAY
jgi:hypothetical protein